MVYQGLHSGPVGRALDLGSKGSKAVVLLLLIHCLLLLPLFIVAPIVCLGSVFVLFCYSVF